VTDAWEFNGTADGDAQIAEALGISEDEVGEAMQEAGLERCDACEWWVESGEVNDLSICNDCEDGGA
jgi:hypothetical protein